MQDLSLVRQGKRIMKMQEQTLAASEVPPSYSPWGRVQSAKRLADGIWSVSTASHGGIWLSGDRLAQLNALLISHYPTFCGSDNWWEEDCDWCVPYVAFAADIDDPAMSDTARRQLSCMGPRLRDCKYTRAWSALCGDNVQITRDE